MTNKPIVTFLILFFLANFIPQALAQPSTEDSLRHALDIYEIPAKFLPKDTVYFSMADAICSNYLAIMELDSLAAFADR